MVKTVNPKVQKTVNAYRKLLKRGKIPVEKMIVFGSYAKGHPKPWSDIDICVVSPLFGRNRFDERVQLMKLAIKVSSDIEPHPYNPNDLLNRWDPLAREIRRYGQVV